MERIIIEIDDEDRYPSVAVENVVDAAFDAARYYAEGGIKRGASIMTAGGLSLGDGWNTREMHAEAKAAMAAVENWGHADDGRLFVVQIDPEHYTKSNAGEPCCPGCARSLLRARVGSVALWNDGGFDVYPMHEYAQKVREARRAPAL